ncbi:MAG: vWA domain-containing protein [Gammaproteobacteria bacterium]|jgi:hypothetical protein
MLFSAVIAVTLIIAMYWLRYLYLEPGTSGRSISVFLFLIFIVALSTIAYIERMDRSTMLDDVPVVVALTTDLSLSMGATPDPREHGAIGTRLERAQKTLLPILNALESSGATVMMGITGFTAKSEMIMGWDSNIPQIREVIEYSMAPGLLTQPGSDLGVALQGVIPLFENLPEDYQNQETKKYLIVVSDGEQTLDRGEIETALAELRANEVSVIALQVGLSDIPEGIPVYDEAGTFFGFQDIGGQVYTVPDTEIMTMIVGTDPATGLYVRGEDPDAVLEISNFIGVRMSALSTSGPLYTAVVSLLWGLSFAILLWFV